METLADAFSRELARCRELLQDYRSIGPSGVFGAAMIEAVLREAEKAAADGDAATMLAIYQKMINLE